MRSVIYKILTFSKPTCPKVGIKLLLITDLMPESLVFSHAKILFLVSLLFGALRSIPIHYLKSLIFYFQIVVDTI